jgi:hypothetical protein
MGKKISLFLKTSTCILLAFLLIGCGTLLYPKRIGQRSGNIDAGVAVLDGLCLLLFVVPGIVAFVVDFSNGTIYLPGGNRSMLDREDAKKISFDARRCTIADIEKIVKNETGYEVDRPDTRIYAFSSMKELDMNLAALTQNTAIAVCSK